MPEVAGSYAFRSGLEPVTLQSTTRIAACPKQPPRHRHPTSSIAFPLLAITLFLFFVSASVPSPLFVVFQGRWGVSPRAC